MVKKLMSAFDERENCYKVVIYDALMSKLNNKAFVMIMSE